MFWQLLPGHVIGGQEYRVVPLGGEAWMAFSKEISGRTWPHAEPSAMARFTREYVLKQFRQSFVDDRFELNNTIQTKAEFSYAIAVMDKIEGWEEEAWSGPSMRICTKAAICNGQNYMQDTGCTNSDPHHGSSESGLR